jgi:DUF1680 family protein
VLLGRLSGDERFISWGEKTLYKWDEWLAAYPESTFTCDYTSMKQFAAGEKDVYELREPIHAHTYHMTLLGLAELYAATGKDEYRDVVLASIDRLTREWIFLTGGMSSDERYAPRRYYHPRGEIEVCPQHTWILLLDQALRWTGEACYAAEIERDIFNHFLAAQLADGTNWSYMTPLNGRAQEPWTSNCCNGAGQRIAARMPTFLYGLRNGAPAVIMYTTSEARLEAPGLPAVTLRQETDFPSDGEVAIQLGLEQSARFPLHLRIPSYAEGAVVQVGNETLPAQPGEFTIVDREWADGDRVHLSLPLHIKCQGRGGLTSVIRGPLVYAYFQDAQEDSVTFYGCRGRYPEDVCLYVDPSEPEQYLEVEQAPDELLGPALRVSGAVRARPPVFACSEGNAALAGTEEDSFMLLPFANQGAVRGDYGVFLNYSGPKD